MVSQYTDKSGSRYIVKFLTFSLKKLYHSLYGNTIPKSVMQIISI